MLNVQLPVQPIAHTAGSELPAKRPAASLLLAIDTLELPFAFLDRGGHIHHASPAFARCLDDGDFADMPEAIRRLAAVLWGMVNVRSLGGQIQRLVSRSLLLRRGECHVQGTYVGVDLFGDGPSVLVGVRMPPADPYSSERLRARFGLTRKQSTVARLLAEGLRNDEIARRLFISPHTARHHVEQIRLKVGGHTRAAVATRILQIETRTVP